MTSPSATVPPPSRLLLPANPSFSENTRKARYGVAYLETLCAQAGLALDEVSIDTDNLAFDATLQFARIGTRIQVKCSAKWKVGNGSATLPLEEGWVKKWGDNIGPTYVVLVKVPSEIPSWIEHSKARTKHRAAAFGVRFDPALHVDSMTFTEADRLTAETLYDWREETYAFFDGLGGGAP